MKLIRQGAEAKLYLCKWNGIPCIKKVRIRKNYRNRVLDEALRSTRTKKEIRIMHRIKKFGINTPSILHINLGKFEFYMEYIEGKKARELIEGNLKLCEKIGKNIAALHKAGVIHGDLTLDNIIVKDGKPFFIDFGLGHYSESIEERATDLLNLKRSMLAENPKLIREFERILESYKKNIENGNAILQRIKIIESRARYVERV